MNTTVLPALPEQAADRPPDGGAPARRAMIRWAWRLFRREWRQQLLVLALVTVAVGATFVGAAVAVNTPPPPGAGFGTAQDLATFQAGDPHTASQIAALRHRFGRVEVIENEQVAVPGSVNSFELRAQDPQGPFGGPMLSLSSGRYPQTPGDVAVTQGVASEFQLALGSAWHIAGTDRRVVGIVENPQSLLDEFALVPPGQVPAPTRVTVLFDAPGVDPASLGPNVETPASVAPGNSLNPETIVLALATLGMLLIGLVAVGGFTVLAQRRLRAIGMIGAVGATDRHVRLVVRANGAVVGAVGSLLGGAIGIVAWLAYRPHLEISSHHLIGVFALPWVVILPAMALAVLATYLAATRPAHAVVRVPIVAALSGRPAPPRQPHRSAIPGAVFLAVAFVLLSLSGSGPGTHSGAQLELVLGFVALVAGLILFAPTFIVTFARAGRRAPIAVRLALGDLARYRSRSSSALGAISLGVLIAALISVVAAARYGNVLDYAGPNLASNQLVVYAAQEPGPGSVSVTPNGPTGTTGPSAPPPSMAAQAKTVQSIAAGLSGSRAVELDQSNANLEHAAPGRNWNGPIYVATPQLLALLGINPSQVDPSADIITMRPGLSTMSRMLLDYDNSGKDGPWSPPPNFPCNPGACLANPPIQYLPGLPSGTSAPNTLITEHAVQQLHLQVSVAGWMVVTPHPLSAAQITNANEVAAAGDLTVETKSDAPSSAEVIYWATAFGILLSLGILAMTVGLIRSETAADLRTLTATGAGTATRREVTGATAGALALLGAVLGTAAAYLAALGWFRSNTLNGGLSALGSVPVLNLLLLLIGMPIVASLVGWLVAGREPPATAHSPLE